jgi:hypothetical protein
VYGVTPTYEPSRYTLAPGTFDRITVDDSHATKLAAQASATTAEERDFMTAVVPSIAARFKPNC